MASQKINFDPRFIDVCVDSLLNLKKQNERYDSDEIWSSGILNRLNHLDHWSEDIPLLSEAKDTLRSLAGVKGVLEHLLESLQNTTKTVAKTLLPFQRGRGLASLPDDVLSMIFVYAGSKSTLDLVCRRFRHVASAIPQLWNYISNSMMSMRLVNASLKESKAVGLDIELYLDPANLDVLQVFDAAVVHLGRWDELRVWYPDNASWQKIGPRITQMEERTKNIHMPRLRTLSLNFRVHADEDVLDESDSAIHFYRTWSLPSLRHLQVIDSAPVPFAAPSLTSLSFILRASSERGYSLLRLFHFLSSVPYLEDLELFFDRLVEDQDLPEIALHHLKTLRMHFVSQSEPHMLFNAKALITPAIRSMYLTIVDESNSDLDTSVDLTRWLNSFFCHDSYPTLEDFTLEFIDVHDHSPKFDIPFEKLPKLHTLTLDTSDWLPRESRIFPPLRSLHLKGHLNSRWTTWLWHVQEKMLELGNLTDFQDLTIEVQGNLDKIFIERLFSENRVVWR